MNMVFLGFDIGGTKCATIIARKKRDGLEFLHRTQAATQGSWKEILNRLCEDAEKGLQTCGFTKADIAAIGVSCGGPLNAKSGLILSPPNLPGWNEVPVCEYMQKRFQAPVRLMNDADACAVAEWKFGAGKGCRHMAFLTFGTGLGAGLILNGALYEGANNNAGEVGHIRISPDGPPGYGKRGSFEGYCSGGGIAKLARSVMEERLQRGEAPQLLKNASLEAVSAKLLAERARDGDEDALNIYRETGYRLGCGLSVLIDILNPEKIVLGGIFMRAEDLLRDSMEKALRKECLNNSLACVRIVPSKLEEKIGDYGAVVAAMSALDERDHEAVQTIR